MSIMGIRKKFGQKGFTIFELIVVLSILGILAGVLYPRLQNRELAAKLMACEMDMLRIYEACEAWKSNQGQTSFTGLTYAALGTANLLDTSKTNPWGSVYDIAVSTVTGTNDAVTVYSGAISDATIQSTMNSRFSNKNYTTGTETSGTYADNVWFRAPN